MKKPPTLKFGPTPLQDWAKEMELAVLERTPLNGEGTDIQEQPDGFCVNTKPDTKTGGASGSGYFEEKTVPHLGGVSVQGFWVDAPPRDP